MKKTTLFARLKKPWEGFSVEIYSDKLAESGKRIVRESYEEARRLNHNQLNPEHVLIAFANLEQELFDSLLRSLGLDRQTVLRELSTPPNQHKSEAMRITKPLSVLLSNSLRRAREQGRRRIEAFDIMVAIFEDEGSLPVKLLKKSGVHRYTVIGEVNRLANERK